MYKKITISLSMLVMVLCCFFSSTSEVHASYVGREFTVNYAKPSTSDSQGYISLFLRHKNTGDLVVSTTFWYCIAQVNGYEAGCGVYIDVHSDKIKIGPYGAVNATGAMISVSRFEVNGALSHLHTSNSSAYVESYGEYSIIGYKYGGNVALLNNYLSYNDFFTVYYTEDESAMLLKDLYNLVQSQNIGGNLQEVINQLTNIYNMDSSINSKLAQFRTYLKSCDDKLTGIQGQLDEIYNKIDKVLTEQKETNNWLEKIFNYLDEKNEKDKEQAQTQGNTSVSQGTASIEDKGAGFVNSMGGLVSSMSYNGTQCAWTFPEVRLPAIAGVMNEVVLIEEQPIDFSVWINAIPAPILILIQSLLTMGLIVYCFKELYGTISYVLTLRGGGSNE